jgi:hypothetical protein
MQANWTDKVGCACANEGKRSLESMTLNTESGEEDGSCSGWSVSSSCRKSNGFVVAK